MGRSMAQAIEERAEARGRAEGEARGLRAALRAVLQERFGMVPPEAEARLSAADSERLDAWLRAALRAPALEDVGILDRPSR